MKEPLFIDISCYQLKKWGQNAFGDTYMSKRFPEQGRLIATLSDGLGSGIKANILSQMTATMLLKFVAAGKDILRASEVIMNSLPICQVRKISYATFSIIDCYDNGSVRIIEEGNPQFVWLRGASVFEPEAEIIESKNFSNRQLQLYNLQLQPGDRLVFCSDGVTQAGMGSRALPLGWKREGLIRFLVEEIIRNPFNPSNQLATAMVETATTKEKEYKLKDDAAAMVLHFRKPRKAMVFTGLPYYESRDSEYAERLADFQGKKAVCGGSTANMIARELKRPIKGMVRGVGDLPPCSLIDGIDLVTEGILTLSRTADYLENGIENSEDPAGLLCNLLLNSDCIEFLVGAKFNMSHFDPDLPIELEIRKTVVKKMIKLLTEKHMKKVEAEFF